MTEAQATRLVCEAVLLDDAEAAWVLRGEFEALPYDDEGKGTLLIGLACLYPEEARTQAYELAHPLRVLALAQHLERLLAKKDPRAVRCAWRWLLRSDRVIASVADEDWRGDLEQRRVQLVERIPKSRKARHLTGKGGNL
jgi:hypothetical protein